MTKATKTLMFVAACAAPLWAIAAGCTSTVNSVDINESGSYKWIETDSELSRVAQVQKVSKAKVGDLLRVEVTVLNTRGNSRTIQYRYVWLDANGMEFKSPMTTWQRVFLRGQQTAALTGVAPSPIVTDCRLEILRADE